MKKHPTEISGMSSSVQSTQINMFSRAAPLQRRAVQGERLSEEILPPLLRNSQDLMDNCNICKVF